MAVIVGEAAVRIRPDVDAGEFRSEVEKPVGDALEDAGGSGAAKFTAAFGAALAIGGAFATSLEQAALGDKLAAQLGLTATESERVGGIAGDLYANAYGDSLETVNDAVGAVLTSIDGMGTASSAELEAVTTNALDFATAMNVDVAGAATSAGILVKTGLAADAQGAFDLMTAAAQEAGPAMVEPVLDAANEYGTNFAAMGFTGEQAMALLVDASEGGEIALDKAGDAVKEFGIRATDLGDTGAQEALKGIGLNGQDMANALLAGGDTAQGAFGKIVAGLQGIDDPAQQASASVALFGTPLEDLGKDKIPGFLDSMSMAGGELENVAGAADRMGDTLNDNASTNLTSFSRTAQQAFVNIIGGQVVPIVEGVASLLVTLLGPTLEVVAGIVTSTVIPAFQALGGFISDHSTTFTIAAGIITALFLPALIAMGIQALISGAQTVAGWASAATGAVVSALGQSIAAVSVVASWVGMAVGAAVNAAAVVGSWLWAKVQTVASWVLMAAGAAANAIAVGAVWIAQTTVSTATLVAGWIATGISVAAAWVSMAAVALANAVAVGAVWLAQTAIATIGIIAGWAIAVATVVGGWLVMAATSLASAIGMAAAWLIALGPIGIVIAVVIGLVALIIANWDKVKKFTVDAFHAIVDAVVKAFNAVKDGVVNGVSAVIDFVSGMPNRILRALGNLGSLLLGAGGDLIRGLVNGISGAAGFVGDVAGNIWKAIRGFVNSNVIDRLNGLLEFTVAGIHVNPPDIPRLHSGGVYTSGVSAGEGLALLRDDELVATPEQRVVADTLLRGLLAGRLPAATAPAAAAAPGAQVTNHIYASEGMSTRELGAIVSRDTVWSLGTGATRLVPIAGGAR